MQSAAERQGAGFEQTVVFLEPTGAPARQFDRAAERLMDVRADAVKGAGDPGREALVRTASGSAFRPLRDSARRFTRELQSSADFKLRDFFGQDWPSHVTPQGGQGGGASVETRLDVAGLGTYADLSRLATRGGQITHCETYENASAARMGGYVRGIHRSPGDHERLEAHAESGFWWPYTPTKDCRLEVRGTGVQTYSRHFRELHDQGGFQVSNCNVDQSNFLTTGFFFDDSASLDNYGKVMNPVGPGSTYVGDGQNDDSFQDGWWDTTGSGSPDVDELRRGGNRTLQFAYRPSVTVAAGRTVYGFIGARAALRATLDDVEATIRQGGTWRLRSLAIAEIG